MKLEKIVLSNFRCFGAQAPLVLDLDPSITVCLGTNGSGKTAALQALLRLFGETREERALRVQDFHLLPGERLEDRTSRELFIEATISFPELTSSQSHAHQTVPPFFQEMVVEKPGAPPFVRVRLEGSWERGTTLDGTIEEQAYFVLDPLTPPEKLAKGDAADGTKPRLSQAERSNIAVRYIPATRDIRALSELALRSLGRELVRNIQWKQKDNIQELLRQLQSAFAAEPALRMTNHEVNRIWRGLDTVDTGTDALLTIIAPDFDRVTQGFALMFTQASHGRNVALEDLSDGQRSLFHFVLVKAILDLKLHLEARPESEPPAAPSGEGHADESPGAPVKSDKQPSAEVRTDDPPSSTAMNPAAGESGGGAATPIADPHVPFARDYMRPPPLTVFAFEEPENHLSPFFLSRLVAILETVTRGQRAQGVITSHSASIVRRLEPAAVRYFRRDIGTGHSSAQKISIPGGTEGSKFLYEAVRAHPEIYFARLALFCEGTSEEIVLPKLASALGFPLDPSFVAIVPVEGRHVHHFWRLASHLRIPYVTLLDFDLGRSSGDVQQLHVVADELLKFCDSLTKPQKTALAEIKLLKRDSLDRARQKAALDLLESHGVFFSAPLDLDMLMLQAFPDEYTRLEGRATGPQKTDEEDRQVDAAKRALGKDGIGHEAYGSDALAHFPWYTYLFMDKRGKPASHLAALARINEPDLGRKCPEVLVRLFRFIGQSLGVQAWEPQR